MGIGLIAILLSSCIACGLTISYKVIHEVVLQKYNKYKKRYEKDQQTIKPFDILYRNSLQNKIIDEKEYESLCKVITKYFEETKNEIFLQIRT